MEHIWLPCSSSSDDTDCYLGDRGKCERSGDKLRCTACHVVAHSGCLVHLSTGSVQCKTTFREPHRKGREAVDALGGHHWVHRWKYEGRCSGCAKSFHQKIFFKGIQEKKEPAAVTCSWCKESFHLKNCFDDHKLNEKCDKGGLRDLIVPPQWIVRASKKRKMNSQNPNPKSKTFMVRRADSWLGCPSQPLLVFVNPKSGGNKGAKALQTFCWLLNPRQVFDITSLKGPKFGLELYRKVLTHLRILVCGGDGTVGWVLSTLDKLSWPVYPPIGIMPFGTGNDLSRCLGWGGSFSDEPLSQLLNSISHETTVTQLDRWKLQVMANVDCPLGDEEDEEVQSSLPLTVMNNYFSIGADAHVALQFHHSRSANPQMLNSRLKNRIAYGGLGTIDLFKRSWKDLSEFVQLECDGVDLTPKIKELKLHCILFHNITYYAGGTVPWGQDQDDSCKASYCDGRIEVLGFTTATLAALQMGGRGERIAQCSTARMKTTKAIPMQVDGEPVLLAPSLISLSFHSKVPMMRREKKGVCAPPLRGRTRGRRSGTDSPSSSTSLIVQIPVLVVGRHDYDTFKDSLERLKDTAFEIGTIKAETEMELSRGRQIIDRLLVDHPCLPYEYSSDWSFLDYVSNADEGTFRVSRQEECVMAVSDASNTDDCLLILDDSFPSMTERSREILTSHIMFLPSNDSPWQPPTHSTNRRISETLRIVLSADAQETHL
ncbi:hypothetical protein PMAYCL1PPCAC_07108 [Pristionchus mayeri]|uniref:Diacylglycerol kinase n=1 Tax=Pristionchus mayeri TaxID=1317129 RepID=A0AAN4ZE79_9BILA|nr:hypothetical protein PMAYCL1PPCAC_07108 [Pristionchus mayeri]